MNQNGYFMRLIRSFYPIHYITKESFLIKIIAKEDFIAKFLIILLKLL